MNTPLLERECGDCTVCCKIPPIDSPEFSKQAGVLCTHCVEGRGCQIYEKRPEACRSYFCGWRVLDFIPHDLRPDKSGIMVVPDDAQTPPGYRDTSGIKFVILDAASVRRPSFIACLSELIRLRIATFLAVPGPPGHFFAKAFLNPLVHTSVEAGNTEALHNTLTDLVERLKDGVFEPVVLTGAGAGHRG